MENDSICKAHRDIVSKDLYFIFKDAKHIETKKQHEDIFNYLLTSMEIELFCAVCDSNKITSEILATKYYQLVYINNNYYEESE